MAKRATKKKPMASSKKAAGEPAAPAKRAKTAGGSKAAGKKEYSPNYGGRREGAGRKPILGPDGKRLNPPRIPRPTFKRNQLLVVTLQFQARVKSLRAKKLLPEIEAALAASDHAGDFQVEGSQIEARRIRLMVRAVDKDALTSGMRGLGARCSRAINGVDGGKGSALHGRFELAVPSSPEQAAKLLKG